MSIQLREFFINPDDYERGKQLGRGACGVVFEAKEKRTGKLVAMKVLDDLSDPRDLKLFVREVVVPVKLSRLSIVHMLGFRFPEPKRGGGGMEPGIIVTELMRNGTLKDVLQRKFKGNPEPRFGPTEWTKAIYGIAHAMREVHKADAMHRDLKPENVFLDDNFEIKIADFGLSKLVKDGLQNTLQLGSPIFMAPELMSNDRGYDSSVDVYAYGVLVYQTFTDNMQLAGKGQPTRVAQLMMRVGRGERLRRMPEIPDKWWDLIQSCWDQDATSRPTFSAIVDLLAKSEDLVIEGTDMAKYREYQRRLEAEHTQEDDVKRLLESSIMRSTGIIGRGGPPSVAALALDGETTFADLYNKEMTRSMRLGVTQEVRPFPFKKK